MNDTEGDLDLDREIQYDVDYPGHKDAKEGKVIGVIAGDEDSYEVSGRYMNILSAVPIYIWIYGYTTGHNEVIYGNMDGE